MFCLNDEMAAGAYHAARKRGMDVPDDLSIIGFDDIPQSGWVRPGLTTVRQPAHDKGRMAASLLIALVSGSALPQHATLSTELVIRGSVGPPAPVSAPPGASTGVAAHQHRPRSKPIPPGS